MNQIYRNDRRQFLTNIGTGLAALGGSSLFMERCYSEPGFFAEHVLTPRQTEGPFYPNHLPLDTDNDLLIINDSATPAVGEICHLSGRVLTQAGSPVRNAVVEIWQADNNGCYIHTGSNNRDQQDKNFQGFGRFMTNSKGEYYFRTIKPVPYQPRTPHVHVAVYKNGHRMLTTQCYINGHPLNEDDVVLKGLSDPSLKKLLMVDFERIPETEVIETAGTFDIVIGNTPEDQKKG